MKRKKQRIRVLFAGLFVFLFFQSALILFLGEPWPSISFPRFSAPGGQTQTFTATKPVLVAHFDEAEKEVGMDRFLNMVPDSHHMSVVNENYRPVSSPGNKEKGGRGERMWTERLKDWAASTLRSPEPEVAPARTEEGKQWTRKRLKELFPERSPDRFVVEWREVKYERSGDRLIEKDRSLVDRISIDL
jgi:hypothetical protein